MNILLFTQNYPRGFQEPVVSGMVKNPFYLSRELQKMGNTVTVITSGSKRDTWNFDGVDVHCVGKGFLKGVISALFTEVKMLIKFFLVARKKNIDIVHIHHINILPLFLIRKFMRKKFPIIYTAHGTSTPELHASFQGISFYKFFLYTNGKIQHIIDRLCWKYADAVITPSKFQIKEMIELYGVSKEKIICIYNGVDCDRYFRNSELRDETRKRCGISTDSPLVLFVGRIARKKGIHLLIQSMQLVRLQLPKVRLLCIMGNMGRQLDYRSEIYDLVAKSKYSDSIILKEGVPESDLPGYYNAADVCVFPSTGYESIPTVIYESLACGVPVITSKSWGIEEIIDEVLIGENDMNEHVLAQAIVRVLTLNTTDHKDATPNDGIRSSCWDSLAKRHQEFYEHCIESIPR